MHKILLYFLTICVCGACQQKSTCYPIRNLIFSNLVMLTSNRGIGVFARDNSSIENVMFDNIIMQTRLHSGHWWGKGEPIHISYVKNLSLTGLTIAWGKSLPSFFTNGVEIHHFDGLHIENFQGSPAPGTRGFSAVNLSDGINSDLQISGKTSVVKENVR